MKIEQYIVEKVNIKKDDLITRISNKTKETSNIFQTGLDAAATGAGLLIKSAYKKLKGKIHEN